MPRRRRDRAFTAREVAMALLLLAAFSGFVATRLVNHGVDGATVACRRNVAAINQAIEKWFFDHGRWPAADLSDIAHDKAYFPNGLPRCPVTGRPYVMDPHTHRVTCPRCRVGAGARKERSR